MSSSPPWDPTQRPDVAILVALPEEFRSLAVDYSSRWHPQRNLDHPGTDFLFVGPGGYRCIATIMPRMGPTVAGHTSMRLLAKRPAVVINIGIAGGFKDDLRIGDVIVPRQVDAYDETGKINGARWERRGSDYRPSADLVAEVRELEFTSQQAHAAWVDAGARELAGLRKGQNRAFVDALLERKLLREQPITSTSHLASGSFVVASKPFAQFLRETNADIHAGEMEAAGVLAAAEYWREGCKTLVVRGISDHVDADKSEVDAIGEGALRRLAMANAWRLVSGLMELGMLPRIGEERPKNTGHQDSENPNTVLAKSAEHWMSALKRRWAESRQGSPSKAIPLVAYEEPKFSCLGANRRFALAVTSAAIVSFGAGALTMGHLTSDEPDARNHSVSPQEDCESTVHPNEASTGTSQGVEGFSQGTEPADVGGVDIASQRSEIRRLLAEQKGLQASTSIAKGGAYFEASVLAIEAVGAYASDFDQAPALAYEGLLNVLSAAPALQTATMPGGGPILSPDGTLLVNQGSEHTAVVWNIATREIIAVLRGHSSFIDGIVFSPNGKFIATASRDGTVRIWDVTTGNQVTMVKETLSGFDDDVVAFSPNSIRFATASEDGNAHLWDVSSGSNLAILRGHSDEIEALAFSPDGSRLATASRDQTARLWDVRAGESLRVLKGHSHILDAVSFSPDGTRLATASNDRTVRIWDVFSGESIAELRGHLAGVTMVEFSPDGAHVVTASDSILGGESTARIWDAASGAPVLTLYGHFEKITDVAYAPGGARLATSSRDNTVRIWDAASGHALATLPHSGPIWDLAFSPDNKRLFTGSSAHGTVSTSVWDIAPERSLTVLPADFNWYTALKFSPDGRHIVVGGDSGKVRLWDVTTGKLRVGFESDAGLVYSLSFSPDGTRLVTAGDDKVRLWDATTGTIVATMGHSGVTAVGYSPDGTYLATGGTDDTARIWSGASGKLLATLAGHTDPVKTVTFSPDGTLLATGAGGKDGAVRLWEVTSGRLISTLGNGTGANVVMFSPDGKFLVAAGPDVARIWDVASGKEKVSLVGHSQGITAVLFSPDGTSVATTSYDETARIWDADSGECLYTLQHQATVNTAAFSPDGTRVATASDDDTARLWDVRSGRLLGTLRGHSDDVRMVEFSPDGRYLATGSLDQSVMLWPMPRAALELACLQVQPAIRYDEVAGICDALIAEDSD